jgi:hypothetical protein
MFIADQVACSNLFGLVSRAMAQELLGKGSVIGKIVLVPDGGP